MSRSPELAAATVDQVGELIAVPSINIANGAPSMDSLAWARDVEEPDDPVMTSAGVGTVAVVDKSRRVACPQAPKHNSIEPTSAPTINLR